jgi:hypothetical protein
VSVGQRADKGFSLTPSRVEWRRRGFQFELASLLTSLVPTLVQTQYITFTITYPKQTPGNIYPSSTKESSFLHLQLHIAIKFEKSGIDGDGGATNADDTVLRAHASDEVQANVCDRMDSQKRCQCSKRAAECRRCQNWSHQR